MFSRKGFTILELMIVLAVIAILVGMALPRFKGMQDEGNIARAKGELRTLQTALESYRTHTGAYPTGAEGLAILIAAATSPNVIGSALPTDPFNSGADYGYIVNGSYYAVWSVGTGANGSISAINATTGVATEANGTSCIYATNGSPVDPQP